MLKIKVAKQLHKNFGKRVSLALVVVLLVTFFLVTFWNVNNHCTLFQAKVQHTNFKIKIIGIQLGISATRRITTDRYQ